MSKQTRRFVRWATTILLGGVGAWWWLTEADSGLPKSNHFCEVEVLARPTLRDARLELVDVSCDTLAKDETIRLYGLTAHRSLFGGAKDEAKLLFSYDPGDDPPHSLPQIRETSGEVITISIPRVSSISYKANRWHGIHFGYEIEEVDYP